MIYAYYGFGQGKTSTLNGLCLRLINSKKPLFYGRFFKGINSSEDISLKKLGIDVKKFQTSKSFIWTKDLNERKKIISQALSAVDFLLKNYQNYYYLILDECLDLVTNKILSSDEFCNFIKTISTDRCLFISGHYMDDKIKSVCDVITNNNKIKHHFDKGINAKKFIDL